MNLSLTTERDMTGIAQKAAEEKTRRLERILQGSKKKRETRPIERPIFDLSRRTGMRD